MTYALVRPLGADSNLYPWHQSSPDTLKLEADTNDMLKVAGYCPVPSTGILDGTLCGARNFLSLHSQQLFGKSIDFPVPGDCTGHEDEWSNPTFGCYRPSSLPLSKTEWILVGGAASAILAVFLLAKNVKPKA